MWIFHNRSHEYAQSTAPTSQNFIKGCWCKFVICTTFKDQIATTNYPHHSKICSKIGKTFGSTSDLDFRTYSCGINQNKAKFLKLHKKIVCLFAKKLSTVFCLVLLQVPKCFVPVQIFWASPKIWLHLVPLQKLLCRHENQFYWMRIIFLSGTKCLWLAQYVNKILGWL